MSTRNKDVRLNFHLRKAMTPQQITDMYNDFADEYEEISGLGFEQDDALDPAQTMSDAAKARNVYRRLICTFLNKERVEEFETGDDPSECVSWLSDRQKAVKDQLM